MPKDEAWTSRGLSKREAISQWRSWAASTIAPIEVTLFDADDFAARWVSHGIGQLRLLHLYAPAQRVIHTGSENSSGRAAPSIQLVYARHGTLKTQMGGKVFNVEPGQFVLLDNRQFYQMDMATEHEAIDLMMPQAWLERHLPNFAQFLAQPFDTRAGWGAPLGALLETVIHNIDDAPIPRSLIAEQLGSLLGMATGYSESDDLRDSSNRPRGQLTRQILRLIEREFADPIFDSDRAAKSCGISKRYLQTLLARSGTSFVQELNATRADRASEMLNDQRFAGLSITEIAFRSGFLDAGYFSRVFRKRFGISPSKWREGHAPQS